MTVDRQTLATTRRALHGVAENVLAGPQYRHSGTIRLGVTESGFGTVREPFLRVSGAELAAGDRKIPINGATCRELAAAAGIDAGAPEGLCGDGSGVGVDETLGVDAEAAQHIADAFDRGHAALQRFAPEMPPVLWPEHFALGISVQEGNYGVSTGDAHLDEPYAYAGPWEPRQGSFWNTAFGAARPLRLLPGTTAVLDFFMEARDRAARDPIRGR